MIVLEAQTTFLQEFVPLLPLTLPLAFADLAAVSFVDETPLLTLPLSPLTALPSVLAYLVRQLTLLCPIKGVIVFFDTLQPCSSFPFDWPQTCPALSQAIASAFAHLM